MFRTLKAASANEWAEMSGIWTSARVATGHVRDAAAVGAGGQSERGGGRGLRRTWEGAGGECEGICSAL